MSTVRITGRCPNVSCQRSAKIDIPDTLLPHIDRRALAARVLSEKGWTYRGGQMGKSVFSIFCPRCRPKRLVMDGDIDPRVAVPKTYAEDLA